MVDVDSSTRDSKQYLYGCNRLGLVSYALWADEVAMVDVEPFIRDYISGPFVVDVSLGHLSLRRKPRTNWGHLHTLAIYIDQIFFPLP